MSLQEGQSGPSVRAIVPYDAQPIPMTEGDAEQLGKAVIAGILNPNLWRTREGLRTYMDPTSLELHRDCIHLLAAVYWQLAKIVAERQVARCGMCDSIFVVTDQRQKYCPPARGKSESICAARARKQGKSDVSSAVAEVTEDGTIDEREL